MRLRSSALTLATPILLALVACAPVEKETTTAPDPSGGTETAPADQCTPDTMSTLMPGKLTVGTDSPAYDPWFRKNDPTNGKGYESAVAYAVAEQLGYSPDQVSWVKVRFNSSYKPGKKNFDFDINQISITPDRAKVVDFSDGYYTVSQALIALKGSPAADATSVADLKGLKLGAQTGTTSLTAIRDDVQPTADPAVFQDTNAAKQALLNKQVDAIVADVPTAFYITAVEIPSATIVGQFQAASGTEEFGMLFEKGSPLVSCVNQALTALKDDGSLAGLEKQWLSDSVDIPVLP